MPWSVYHATTYIEVTLLAWPTFTPLLLFLLTDAECCLKTFTNSTISSSDKGSSPFGAKKFLINAGLNQTSVKLK